MKISRKTFLRHAMTGSLLAAAGLPSWAQQTATAERKKVLVVFSPDRPIEWFKDGFPMRLVGLPWQEKSERVSLPGMDFQDFLLTSFCAAASKEWPQIDFVAVPEFAVALSNETPTEIRDAPFPQLLPFHARMEELVKRPDVTAVINLVSGGGGDRPRPYGGAKFWLFASGGALTKGHEEANYRVELSWGAGIHIAEIARKGTWGDGNIKTTRLEGRAYSSRRMTDSKTWVDDLPGISGTRAEIIQILTSRAPELVALIRRSADEHWSGRFGIQAMRDQLAMNKERQPYYYTLPF
ncbi:hypothetical protein ACO2Q9_01310 [Variovorax sp. VNK109]|uniref:hypothetical protein n=1 Tax=Variovorax sp. VNK109 TaxID=3400919 RepID=UPI003C0B1E5B